MEKNFFVILVEATEKTDAFVQVFWTFANNLGEAIDNVLDFTEHLGYKNQKIGEVDDYDFDSLPNDVVKAEGFEIYYQDSRFYYPIEERSEFQLPYGVALSCIESDLDFEDIKEGYALYRDYDEIEHIEVVVDRFKLLDLYMDIVEKFFSIRVLWIRFAKDWETQNITEFYANESLNHAADIKEFIEENYVDLYQNGYVTITIYSEDGNTNINLDEHKKIYISTTSKKIANTVSKFLHNKGYHCFKKEKFYTIEYGFHHWHYSPKNSKSRKELIDYLLENRFFLWRTEGGE